MTQGHLVRINGHRCRAGLHASCLAIRVVHRLLGSTAQEQPKSEMAGEEGIYFGEILRCRTRESENAHLHTMPLASDYFRKFSPVDPIDSGSQNTYNNIFPNFRCSLGDLKCIFSSNVFQCTLQIRTSNLGLNIGRCGRFERHQCHSHPLEFPT